MMMINAILCLLITLRLFTFNREACKYKVMYGWIAWLMMTSSSAVFIFSFFHLSIHAYVAQLIMNIALLICLLRTKGNLAQVYTQLRPKKKVKQS